VPPITHIVYVVPEEYGKLPDHEAMAEVGQAVSRLNRLLPKRRFILMGPGRWGSRGDIKLGVPVTYADINNTAVLIEVARKTGTYLPDLSFGTHFFQDLVEAQIRYLPLYPDDVDVIFNELFLLGTDNMLAELTPEFAHLSDCIRVINVPAVSGGDVLRVYMNADQDAALAVLQPEEDAGLPSVSADPVANQSRQFWRWRFRMAERMVKTLDAARFDVKGVYLYGPVNDGTARPDSQIDLLVRFDGDRGQLEQLECWIQGWSQALAEVNFTRTGVCMDEMLNVTFLSEAEVEAGVGLAALIGAVTNAARLLEMAD
jgi:hypothetical protein